MKNIRRMDIRYVDFSHCGTATITLFHPWNINHQQVPFHSSVRACQPKMALSVKGHSTANRPRSSWKIEVGGHQRWWFLNFCHYCATTIYLSHPSHGKRNPCRKKFGTWWDMEKNKKLHFFTWLSSHDQLNFHCQTLMSW